MKVVFFHRKPNPGNFSIENLFNLVRLALPKEVQWEVKVLRFQSRGVLKRLYITIEAACSQKGINHITGDIHFIALLLNKRNTVLTIHDLGLLNHRSRLVRLIFKFFWVTMPVRRSALITTVSFATRNELLKYVNTDPRKVKVIYNPVPDFFEPSKKTFNKAEPVILQIGTKANKNIGRLIEALETIPCHLQIIGKLSEELQHKLLNARIKHTVSYSLTNEQIIQKYHEADIISFVSTFEGFGLPIVEGNAVGRVVVTSNVSSMPEVAGDAAHLVNPFDVNSIRNGFLKVINDDLYREQLVKAGFENRERFKPGKIAEQYTDIYRSLLMKTSIGAML
jgi:glycosyltransferase involved in cell wall biosynthesis